MNNSVFREILFEAIWGNLHGAASRVRLIGPGSTISEYAGTPVLSDCRQYRMVGVE